MRVSESRQLVAQLLARPPQEIRAVPWRQKMAVATSLGLHIACCSGCGCYQGAPYCHPQEAAVASPSDECLEACPSADDDADDDEETERPDA
jgi:hypothetical protein